MARKYRRPGSTADVRRSFEYDYAPLRVPLEQAVRGKQTRHSSAHYGHIKQRAGFGAPRAGFGAPSAGFGAPSAGFGAPSAGLGATLLQTTTTPFVRFGTATLPSPIGTPPRHFVDVLLTAPLC